jgi:hypothetical protein
VKILSFFLVPFGKVKIKVIILNLIIEKASDAGHTLMK